MPPAPKRPATVAPDATWSATDKEWGLGVRRDDKLVGDWTWWRKDGSIICRSVFDAAGEPHGACRRFHPNGELAQLTHYEHGTPTGIWIGYASTAPTTESWQMVSGMDPRIVRCELDTAKEIPKRYRYFLPGNVRCNANGLPLAAKPPSLRGASKPFLRVASRSFDDAIARGAAFVRAARAASTHVDQVLSAETRDDGALVRTGRPASKLAIRALEKRYGTLPPSWKTLLARFGTISIESAAGPTTAAARVVAASKEARRTLDEFEEFDEDPEGAVVVSNWRKLKLGHGVLLTPELRAARFAHFAQERVSDSHILALDWRDARGECPILFLPHDEVVLVLEAHDALDWLNRQVDRAIEEIMRRTKALFG